MVGKPIKASTVQLDSPATPGIAHQEREGPAATVEEALTQVLAGVLKTERVSVDDHFFDDLAADSLLMAQFCARVRKQDHLPSVSMKDIYRYPTIRGLATALGGASDPADVPPVPVAPSSPVSRETLTPATGSTPQYVLCGTVQLLVFLGYAYLTALALSLGYDWIAAGTGLLDSYLRAVLFGGAVFVGVCTLPILAKWVLIGRWSPRRIRIWSPAYFRFWVVRTLVQMSPLVLFAGSPVFVLYLKALGAHIGRGVAIFSKQVPVCTDLLTVGDHSVISKDSSFTCYRAEAGWIRTGTVTLGKNVYISEATVLDIDSSLGDEAQLGHASSLHSGQHIPDGERWHGSPAQPAEANYRPTGSARCSVLSKVSFSVVQLLTAVAVYMPLMIGGASLLLSEVPEFSAPAITESPSLTRWAFYRDALVVSFVLFFGSLLSGLLLIATVPRLLHLLVKPDKDYRLYGFHYSLHRAVARFTNSRFLMRLAGDSSYVVHYLRAIGYHLPDVEQTGSNFGTEVKHENPYLSTVGTGTMVADGLSLMNASYTATSFRVERVVIGPHNFLGNQVLYPPQGKTGDNCLLATKVMVPIDGPVREGVGLLGSPSFEIPRMVERDASHLKTAEEMRSRLRAKNRHNTLTLLSFLLARWIYTFGILVLVWGAASFYGSLGAAAIAPATVLTLAFSAVYTAFAERAATGFRQQKPVFCSIYDRAFWRHELFWKHQAIDMRLLNGTPFKGLFWRLLGVRLGRRLFDDGCKMPERTLVTIGDDCTLNAGAVIQCHSQEDGSFKSDRTSLGNGCTVGINTLVHYGVTVGDGVVLAPDSFLMKGEEVPPHSRWGGNPARDITGLPPR
ncbi:Pls/PosA family non-ribosomal peptide synthetase [Streptomyces olivaceiscleroticus]|uniref:Carrier domain-containing protein n=1 Tax=Streptomyces olivaceiscleroticus TaxID=68245 RepID=A0ABN1B6Y6_9ACTN